MYDFVGIKNKTSVKKKEYKIEIQANQQKIILADLNKKLFFFCNVNNMVSSVFKMTWKLVNL